MKTVRLFPNSIRPIAWLLLLPATALGLVHMYNDFSWSLLDFNHSWVAKIYGQDFLAGNLNFTDELAALGILLGLLLLNFSAEKREDEWSASLRLRALSWAVWVHYLVLIVAIIVVHGSDFFTVMVYNMFTLLVLFGLRFRFLLWKAAKQIDEA